MPLAVLECGRETTQGLQGGRPTFWEIATAHAGQPTPRAVLGSARYRAGRGPGGLSRSCPTRTYRGGRQVRQDAPDPALPSGLTISCRARCQALPEGPLMPRGVGVLRPGGVAGHFRARTGRRGSTVRFPAHRQVRFPLPCTALLRSSPVSIAPHQTRASAGRCRRRAQRVSCNPRQSTLAVSTTFPVTTTRRHDRASATQRATDRRTPGVTGRWVPAGHRSWMRASFNCRTSM